MQEKLKAVCRLIKSGVIEGRLTYRDLETLTVLIKALMGEPEGVDNQ